MRVCHLWRSMRNHAEFGSLAGSFHITGGHNATHSPNSRARDAPTQYMYFCAMNQATVPKPSTQCMYLCRRCLLSVTLNSIAGEINHQDRLPSRATVGVRVARLDRSIAERWGSSNKELLNIVGFPSCFTNNRRPRDYFSE